MKRITSILVLLALASSAISAQETLPAWTEGTLDLHFGCMGSSRPGPHGYPLSGITQVGEEIHFNKIIDRDIENLSYPSKTYYEKKTSKFFKEGVVPYWHYQRDSCGTILEDFRVGERHQFKLVNNPKPYRKNFEIYNIASNGFIHTGKGSKVRAMSSAIPEFLEKVL